MPDSDNRSNSGSIHPSIFHVGQVMTAIVTDHQDDTALLRQRSAVLFVVLASYLMIVLDISIVITGLPDIKATLGFSATGLSWVQNIYTLCFGGLLMLGARLGDLLGRKQIFLIGLGLFTLASLAIGMAQTPVWMLAGRALQGVGAALLAPSTLALLSTHFPEGAERQRALAYYAATAGVGASLGLVVGGVFADLVTWRLGFFVNVPLGIVLFVAARRCLYETEGRRGAFDLVGATASTLGMGALVYGIVRSASAGWVDPVTDGAVAIGLVLLAAFIVNERFVSQPILPLRLFAHRERSSAYMARMLFLGAMVSFFFFSTQYMQGVLGFSPLEAGIGFLPMTIPTFATSMLVPRLVRKLGNGGVLAGALASSAIGMFWLTRANADSTFLTDVAGPMLLIGIGNGAALGPLTVSGVAGVSSEDAGAASGLVNVAHQLGGTLGLSILVVVFAAARSTAGEAANGLAHQISVALTGSTVMLGLALLVTLIFLVRPSEA